jgi:hypothetical protein
MAPSRTRPGAAAPPSRDGSSAGRAVSPAGLVSSADEPGDRIVGAAAVLNATDGVACEPHPGFAAVDAVRPPACAARAAVAAGRSGWDGVGCVAVRCAVAGLAVRVELDRPRAVADDARAGCAVSARVDCWAAACAASTSAAEIASRIGRIIAGTSARRAGRRSETLKDAGSVDGAATGRASPRPTAARR